MLFFLWVRQVLCPIKAPVRTPRQCGLQGSSFGNITNYTSCCSLFLPHSPKLMYLLALGCKDRVLCPCSLLCVCTFHADSWHSSSFCRIFTTYFPPDLSWECTFSTFFPSIFILSKAICLFPIQPSWNPLAMEIACFFTGWGVKSLESPQKLPFGSESALSNPFLPYSLYFCR